MQLLGLLSYIALYLVLMTTGTEMWLKRKSKRQHIVFKDNSLIFVNKSRSDAMILRNSRISRNIMRDLLV